MNWIFWVLGAIFILYCIAMLSVPWQVHISMTKRQEVDYGWGTFQTFKREFDKYNWDSGIWSDSAFDLNNNCKVHASIIILNGIGMLMRTPWDFYRANKYVKQTMKKTVITNYDWKIQ